MERRRFIQASLAAMAAFALLRKPGTSLDTGPVPIMNSAAVAQVLVRLFSFPHNARLVGRRYLALSPERADKALLLRDLGTELSEAAARNDPALREIIGARQRRDFARGDTVFVHNWILSRTEASLCALAALS